MSPNSNPTILMFQAEAGFVSKHNVAPFHCPCSPFIIPMTAQTLWFPVRGKRRNGCLAGISLCCKWRGMTDHLISTFADEHCRPIVTYTEMGIVGFGPNRQLRHEKRGFPTPGPQAGASPWIKWNRAARETLNYLYFVYGEVRVVLLNHENPRPVKEWIRYPFVNKTGESCISVQED
ncbi:hypothetical protein TNCV_4135891 [Trichonephila clavipes]|nr:hypothetical protein TNCV_4135891 [Trichonephila clavipes]